MGRVERRLKGNLRSWTCYRLSELSRLSSKMGFMIVNLKALLENTLKAVLEVGRNLLKH